MAGGGLRRRWLGRAATPCIQRSDTRVGALKRALARRLADLSDLVFPRVCAACSHPVEGDLLPHLCTRCAGRVEIVVPPYCRTCGHPFYLEGLDVCPHCLDFTAHYGEARVVVMAKGPVRPLIHDLKYHQGRQVLRDVDHVLDAAPEFLDWLAGAVLVPVPLHPAKERHRGYNQSALLAEVFARRAGRGTCVSNLLRRRRFTVSQTKFDRAERLRALQGAFIVAEGAVVSRSVRYVVVDDVLTTGSTLSHCAQALSAAGAGRVDACAFGHG